MRDGNYVTKLMRTTLNIDDQLLAEARGLTGLIEKIAPVRGHRKP